jgi:hypothetical protein
MAQPATAVTPDAVVRLTYRLQVSLGGRSGIPGSRDTSAWRTYPENTSVNRGIRLT